MQQSKASAAGRLLGIRKGGEGRGSRVVVVVVVVVVVEGLRVVLLVSSAAFVVSPQCLLFLGRCIRSRKD